jgi:hypothetical protein
VFAIPAEDGSTGKVILSPAGPMCATSSAAEDVSALGLAGARLTTRYGGSAETNRAPRDVHGHPIDPGTALEGRCGAEGGVKSCSQLGRRDEFAGDGAEKALDRVPCQLLALERCRVPLVRNTGQAGGSRFHVQPPAHPEQLESVPVLGDAADDLTEVGDFRVHDAGAGNLATVVDLRMPRVGGRLLISEKVPETLQDARISANS